MPLTTVRRKGRIPWYIRGTVNGQRHEESTETTSYDLAEQIRVKRENELMLEAIHGKAVTATFAQAALHYLEQGGSKQYMRKVLMHFKDTLLSKIGQQQVDAAALKLYPDAAPSTRNRQLYTPVIAVLTHAARLGWCAKPAIRRPRAAAGRVRWLAKPEAERLVAASAPHLKPLILFLLYTGARCGEALWLDWRDVDLERKHVQFIDTKNGESRGVPLHPRVVQALVELAEKSGKRSGPVFLTDTGAPYAPLSGKPDDHSAGTRIKTAFSGAVRRAGLSDFHPHDCRHTWATWHYIANRDLGALMRLGGWKTMQMVMRYAHVNVDELASTIERL